ncbi:hypothetical protein OB955_21180 [Halobacteria archaeon AArc-m2/3/4]|uniref:Uncharacterized protein n=1 Tax=Natronoglomus mannanivorans TaxID=2979990 RepID=A0ABT2QJV3_9EURY|nr:hypothetical protein [Halobacteria archaeon AArc-m2/3/4]
MSDRPPSPPTPTIATHGGVGADDHDRLHLTTQQLATRLEGTLGTEFDEETLEEYLLELDRDDYVEWVSVTRTGDYVWDVTESPDRIADAVAEVVVDRFYSWLGGASNAE